MLNAIKMDLYKMFKSKSTWILLICLVAVSFATVGMMKLSLEQYKKNPELIKQVEELNSDDNINVGIQAGTDNNIREHVDGLKYSINDLFAGVVNGSMIGLFIAIFSLIFFNSELKTGYIKNIAGQFTKRRYLIFSKLVVSFVFVLFAFILSLLSLIIGSKLFLGYIAIGGTSALLKVVLTQFILAIAVSALILFIVEWFRNTAGSIVTSMCFVVGFGNLIVMFLNKFLTGNDIIKDKDFNLANYILTGNISRIGPASSSKDLITAAIVAGVFILLSVIGSVLALEKRDIK